MKQLAAALSAAAGAVLVIFIGGAVMWAGRSVPARWYVSAEKGSVEEALAEIAWAYRGAPVEIVILGVVREEAVIENRDGRYPPIMLRGGSAGEPGVLRGTLTVGKGADVTAGEHLTVTARSGRGVEVLMGGRFTLDGGAVADNTAVSQAGAGVYVDGGDFILKKGSVRGNRAVKKGGGGVYVEKGSFTMSGGEVFGNAAEGRAGGGVYIVVGSEFKKTGGVIGGNGVDLGYKGGQVFMAAGRNSRQRGEDAGEDVGLDSGSGENWDGR